MLTHWVQFKLYVGTIFGFPLPMMAPAIMYAWVLVPEQEGEIGQLILVDHEVGPRKVLARDFHRWLTDFADDLENGDDCGEEVEMV